MIKELICEREELEKGTLPHQDLITCLLSIRGETNEAVISDKRDHTQCFAYYDCTSLVRVLANDLDVYAAVLQGMKSYKHGNLITIIEHNEVKVNKTF